MNKIIRLGNTSVYFQITDNGIILLNKPRDNSSRVIVWNRQNIYMRNYYIINNKYFDNRNMIGCIVTYPKTYILSMSGDIIESLCLDTGRNLGVIKDFNDIGVQILHIRS